MKKSSSCIAMILSLALVLFGCNSQQGDATADPTENSATVDGAESMDEIDLYPTDAPTDPPVDPTTDPATDTPTDPATDTPTSTPTNPPTDPPDTTVDQTEEQTTQSGIALPFIPG